MSGFDEFIQKKHDRTIYTEQKQRGIPQQQKVHATVQDIYGKIEKRVKEGSTFEERTRYFFKDSAMLRAKAERYKTLADSGNELRAYSRNYKNHGASKRKKYANKASESFKQAAILEDRISEKTRGLELYRQREKVMLLRMEGMVSAAMMKSKSSADETYRTLKAKYSCLMILMDQLQNLSADVTKRAEKTEFEAERVKLDQELSKVKKELEENVPSTRHKWEREQGLDGIRDKKRRAASAMDILKAGDAVPADCLKYTVRRDRNGMPVDRTELKKDNWNREYQRAIEQNDAESKNRLMTEAFERIGAISIPSPAELSKKGILSIYEQDQGNFADMLRFAQNIDQLKAADPSADDYMNAHPELAEKAALARILADYFDAGIRGTRIAAEKKTQYERKYATLLALEEQRRLQEAQPEAAGAGVEEQQAGAHAEVQRESREQQSEKKYREKVDELRKASAKSYYSNDRLQARMEKVARERMDHYEKLINRKVQDENARQYYKDLASLVIHLDRRSMGLQYVGNPGDIPEEEKTYTEEEITRLFTSLKDNPYRTAVEKAVTDQLFGDSFAPAAERKLTELLEQREQNTLDPEIISIEEMEDADLSYVLSKGRWMYQVSKVPGKMRSEISGIKAAKKLAERLGMPDVLSEVQEIVVKDAEGGEHAGVRYRMNLRSTYSKPQFEGEVGKEITGPGVMFTPEALKQLSSIRLMQYLLGDAGRDVDSSILYQKADLDSVEGTTTMITGIKSDIFGGGFSYVSGRELENGEGNLSPLNRIELPVLDREMVDTILGMKEGEIRELAGGLLNHEKCLYFDSRLRKIQQKLRELKEEDAKKENKDKVIFTKEDWSDTEKLRNLEVKLEEENAQMYPSILLEAKVMGANHGTSLDQGGEDVEAFYNRVYSISKDYVESASDDKEKAARLLELFTAFAMTDIFGPMETMKSINVNMLVDRILGETATKDIMKKMQEGWLVERDKLLQKYKEVSERLKDTEIPGELRNEERFVRAAKVAGDEKTRKKEKEHYIFYVVTKENPELIDSYSQYEKMMTAFSSARFTNYTSDPDLERADEVLTEIWQTVAEEHQDSPYVRENRGELISKLSLVLYSTDSLINSETQSRDRAEFEAAQKVRQAAIARKVLGNRLER